MTKGNEALDALYADAGGSTVSNEFNSFKSGTKYYVKVLGSADLRAFYSYGIYGKVYSFTPATQPDRDKYGNPVGGLTPWDKAWKYHKDQSKEWTDEHGQEASKYRAKQRFAMGFYDLTSGELIVIDVSKNQAQAIHGVIKKFEKRLGQMAFELSKDGQGTSTTVSLTPVMFPEEDLTDEQRKNLDNAPDEFDASRFEGIVYEADEAEQIENLIKAGFDVSLIGLEAPKASEDSSEGTDGETGDEENCGF